MAKIEPVQVDVEVNVRSAGKLYNGDIVPNIKFRGNVIGDLIHDGVKWNFHPVPPEMVTIPKSEYESLKGQTIRAIGYDPPERHAVIGHYPSGTIEVYKHQGIWISKSSSCEVTVPDYWEEAGTGMRIAPFKVQT